MRWGADAGFAVREGCGMRYRPYGQCRALCPYYMRDSRMTISCCALTEEAEGAYLRFGSEKRKRQYMDRHCNRRGQGGCVHKRCLDELRRRQS